MPHTARAIGDFRTWLEARPELDGANVADAVARDQETRWQRGERVLIETYLGLHPALADPGIRADLIYSEILLRESVGDAVSAEEYTFRFPDLSERIARLFKLHQAFAPPADAKATPKINFGTNSAKPTARGVPPVILPGFDILEELGRGGMGVVYKARQHDLGRIVALKVLRTDGFDVGWSDRLRREASALARAQHPNIVQVFDVGTFEGRPYLVMEYLSGETLADRLRDGPLRPREAAELIRTVADAVHAAHEANLVHRDLKPANVLFTNPQ
ncbi:MAG: serine/threonine protein kinase, partial [Gemmataceae bacterium]|nr:serine/threonine protein kinase [Gemmataceae bacterium]